MPEGTQEELYRELPHPNGVIEIRLNRPQVHNAFNEVLIEQLNTRLPALWENPELRLVLLTGTGPSFCAGADLNWMKKMKDYSEEENYQDSLDLARLFSTLNNCPVPLLAKCQGAALGGGVGLLSTCDFVVAANDARFGLTEVTLGLLPAVISPYVIAKIGETHARAWFLSGRRFSTERALAMGLVHQSVPANELDSQFERTVEAFLKAAPHAARHAKQLAFEVLRWRHSSREWKEGLPKGLQESTCQIISQIRVDEEAQEGMSALLEKRPPSWRRER